MEGGYWMSKIIDEKVVEMQFNNKDFENRVQTTMSTLDKLKQKINLTTTTKTLDSISQSVNKFDMNGMVTAVDTVASRFSALEIAGTTALVELTRSAMHYGERIISALTIDPIKTGFQEYETKMNAVQVIKANTRGKNTMTEITSALDELNKYADETIYNFAQMTNNIGKFTAQGLDVKTAANAVKGLANLAGASGASAEDMSRATYQMSQALGGTIKLIDWNSLRNANMATVELKNVLIDLAKNHGIAIEQMIGDEGTFEATLSKGWLTGDMFTEAMNIYSDVYSEAELKARGFTDAQVANFKDLAAMAKAATTDVKTFTQLWDVLKETAQSGWAQTWQIILGDFDDAKELFSGIYKALGPIIEKFAEARNNLLEGAFESKWKKLSKEVSKAGIDLDKFQDELIETGKKYGVITDKMIEESGSFEKSLLKGWASGDIVVETLKRMSGETNELGKSTEDLNGKLEKFQKVVDEVWHGDYGNDEARVKALTKAGYDYNEVQKLVNKTVDGHRLTLEDLGETQLKALGYTEKEIESIKKLAKEAETTGTSLNELVNSLAKRSGRELLLESFSNILQPLVKIINSIGVAWRSAFPPMSSDTLYGIIEGLHTFTTYLLISDDAADKLTRTFSGLFAILDLISMVVGGVFGTGFKIATTILKELWKALGFVNLSILDVTATIGDCIVAFRDWIEEHSLINKLIKVAVPAVVNFAKALFNLAKSAYKLPIVQNSIANFATIIKNIGISFDKYFGNAIKIIGDFISKIALVKDINLKDFPLMLKEFAIELSTSLGEINFAEIGKNIINGLNKGLSTGASIVVSTIISIGQALLDGIKNLLGIHSPATSFIDIGENIILGLVQGIQNGLFLVGEIVKTLFDTIFSIFEDVDIFDIAMFGSIIGVGVLLKKFNDTLKLFAKPAKALAKVFDGFSDVLEGFAKNLDAKAFKKKANAIFTIAKAIAVLSVSLIALTLVDQSKLIGAGIALAGIAVGLTVLAKASQKINNVGNFGKMSLLMISFGISLLTLSKSLKTLSTIDPTRTTSALVQLGVVIGGMMIIIASYGKLVKGKASANIDKVGKMLLKLATSLTIMTLVLKMLGSMKPDHVENGLRTMFAFELLIAGLIAVASFAGKNTDKVGKMLTKMSIAIGILALVTRLLANIDSNDVKKGIATISMISGLFVLILEVSKTAGKNGVESGKLLLKMSVSIGILALTIKLIAGLSIDDVIYGLSVITITGAMFLAFTELLGTISKGKAPDIGGTLLKMSLSISILALVIKMISGMSGEDIAKGVISISMLGFLIKGLIAISKNSGKYADKAGTMILKMSAALGAMAIVIRILKGLTPSDMINGVIFMTACTAMFSALIAVSKMAGRYADKAGAMLLKMTIPITILAATIGLLSLLNPKDIAVASASLSAVLGMFALIIQSTQYMPNSKKAMTPIMMLSVIVGAFAGILYMLSGLPVESTIGTATALSTLLMALTMSIKILNSTKGMSKNVGTSLMAMLGAVGVLALILGVLESLNINLSMENALSISTLLLAMAGVCAILSILGNGSKAAMLGALAFDGVIVVIGALMTAIGALVTQIPELEEFLDKGISVLEKIGYGIGSFLGSFAGGLVAGASNGLPDIAKNLSDFIVELKPFIDGAKGIDANSMNGIKSLAMALLAITAEDVLRSLTSWFTGDDSINDFSTALPKLGEALKGYSDSVIGIDSSSVETSAKAMMVLADLNKSLPNSGGLWQILFGGKQLKCFADNLAELGTGLKNYSDSTRDIDSGSIESSAKAANLLAELNNALPNTGGGWQLLVGEQSLGSFASNLDSLGKGLSLYATQVSGINFTDVGSSASSLKALSKVYEEIPNLGGFFSLFEGDSELDDFGSQLPILGEGLKKYANAVSGISDNSSSIDVSVKAATSLSKIASSLAELDSYDLINFISFGNALPTLGTALMSYSMFTKFTNQDKITNSVSAIESLVGVMKSMHSITSDGAKTFVSSVNSLAEANVGGLITAFQGQSDNLSAIGSDILSFLNSGLLDSKSSLISSISQIIQEMKNEITNKNSDFKSTGEALIKMLTEGIRSTSSNVAMAMTTITSMAIATLKLSYFSFYSTGSYLVDGFADGIRANIYKAAQSAREMASAAEIAAKEELDINSPSKKFQSIGMYTGVGFVDTLLGFANKAYLAGKQISKSAHEGASSVVSDIMDYINGNIDSQITIKPVVDLSNVQTSAQSINSMFDRQIAIGTAIQANNVGVAFNDLRQNGNSDIVSAINKLSNDIAQMKHESYNINGITYDDGSNVSDAIKALIRAIKVEGRT